MKQPIPFSALIRPLIIGAALVACSHKSDLGGVRVPAQDSASKQEQWAQLAPAYQFSARQIPGAKTTYGWKLVTFDNINYRSGIKASYWQALPHGPYNSVFDIEGQAERLEAIKSRVSQNDQEQGGNEGCLPGMVRIKGAMQDWNETVKRQERTCLDKGEGGKPWDPKHRCEHFANIPPSPEIATTAMDFCIDRYEFPNIPGEYPATMVIFSEADNICKAQGKRLCSEDEWTFSCEGVSAMPYPYGYDRYLNSTSSYPDKIVRSGECNIDVLPPKNANMKNLNQSKFERDEKLKLSVEALDGLWRGNLAGENPYCRSEFGVYDLTGNVDEWTVHSPGRPKELMSVLKGGFWGPVRTRCQPATVSHGDGYMNYQSSFRCCASAN